tara:strand:- start:90 stop:353 length:264 start_codon:yes stop_codon:yes gene_type:complete
MYKKRISVTWKISPLWDGGFLPPLGLLIILFYFVVMKINNWLYYISIIIFAFLFISAIINGDGYITLLWGGALLSDIGMLWYNTRKK